MYACVCLNLVSKVQPVLWTSSDVVRLPGSLHHGHSLSLANVAVEIAALTRRPLPCNIPGNPQHILACANTHASARVSACACVYLTRRTWWHTICFSSDHLWQSPLPSSENLPLSCRSTCKQTQILELMNGPSWRPVCKFSCMQLRLWLHPDKKFKSSFSIFTVCANKVNSNLHKKWKWMETHIVVLLNSLFRFCSLYRH